MRNLLAFRGIPLSEPMCFGLGSGAGFLYVPWLPVPPGVAFHGRVMEMERQLCDALAIPFPEQVEKDGDAGWERAREAVLSGHPVLINTDLAHLDYFGTKTHFSGHRIILFGFDDEAGVAILSDSEREEPQEVTVASLTMSRSSSVPPYPMENRWCVVRPEGQMRPLPEAIPLALGKNASEMLSPEQEGAAGPAVEAPGLAGKMVPLADGWTEIAAGLKGISESGDPGAFSRVSDLLLRQADREEAFWREVASLV
jgi:hypothetical protein